jgi:hypothetical protein
MHLWTNAFLFVAIFAQIVALAVARMQADTLCNATASEGSFGQGCFRKA